MGFCIVMSWFGNAAGWLEPERFLPAVDRWFPNQGPRGTLGVIEDFMQNDAQMTKSIIISSCNYGNVKYSCWMTSSHCAPIITLKLTVFNLISRALFSGLLTAFFFCCTDLTVIINQAQKVRKCVFWLTLSLLYHCFLAINPIQFFFCFVLFFCCCCSSWSPRC